MWHFCVLVTVINHHSNSFTIFTMDPFSPFQWPILVILCNCYWKQIRFAAKITTCLCYVGCFYNYIFDCSPSYNIFDYSAYHSQLNASLINANLYWVSVFWVLAFCFVQILIWAPTLFERFKSEIATMQFSIMLPFSWVSFSVPVIIGFVLTCLIFLFTIGLSGLGHGVDGPAFLTMTPFTLLQWPVVVALANVPWSRVRLVAKVFMFLDYALLLYYIFHRYPFGLIYDFQKISATGGPELERVFIYWALAFILIHCLIWLPSIFSSRKQTSLLNP
jgi:hypothetical protein